MALLREDRDSAKGNGSDQIARSGRPAAIAGIAIGLLGIAFSLLTAVTSLAAATLAIGLIVGVVLGVLITPNVRRAAAWLNEYLRQ